MTVGGGPRVVICSWPAGMATGTCVNETGATGCGGAVAATTTVGPCCDDGGLSVFCPFLRQRQVSKIQLKTIPMTRNRMSTEPAFPPHLMLSSVPHTISKRGGGDAGHASTLFDPSGVNCSPQESYSVLHWHG